MMSLEEAVAFLGDTPYPVSRSKLETILKGAPRGRDGRRYLYRIADVLERHRDYAKGQPRRRG